MRHEVPTHLQVQDRFIVGLTSRQLLYLSVGAALGYGLWLRLGPAAPVALRWSVVGVMLSVAMLLAFVRPAGRDLEDWLITVVRYASLPKVAVWRRRRHLMTPMKGGKTHESTQSHLRVETHTENGERADAVYRLESGAR